MKSIKFIIGIIIVLICLPVFFLSEEAHTKAIVALIISIPFALKELFEIRKQKKYEEDTEEYQIADIENVSDDIRGSCLYYACEKGDDELRRYLKGLVNSNVITCEQGGKLFYEYAQKQNSRF